MAKSYGNPVTSCPKCNAAVGDEHPYQWCSECGEQLPHAILQLIPRQVLLASEARNVSMAVLRSNSEAAGTGPAAGIGARGSAATCVLTGLLFLGVGLHFLLWNTSEVVNLHRLTLGETFSIVGAIFLAVGIRPRS